MENIYAAVLTIQGSGRVWTFPPRDADNVMKLERIECGKVNPSYIGVGEFRAMRRKNQLTVPLFLPI